MNEKLKIKLTPKALDNIELKEGEFAYNRIELTDSAIYYYVNYSYEAMLPEEISSVTGITENFTNKKFEKGVLKRGDLKSVTRSSSTTINLKKLELKEAEFTEEEHMIIIETQSTQIGITCSYEELKQYYPYIEDYYLDGNKWKELIIKEE